MPKPKPNPNAAQNRITHCLSVRNPWAPLITVGLKAVENRTWTTSYRGRIAIHASSRAPMIDQYERFIKQPPMLQPQYVEQFRRYLDEQFDPRDEANQIRSAIIGTVEITGVVDSWADDFDIHKLPMQPGCELGPWLWADPGSSRYLWLLARPCAFESSISCDGKLNLWTLGAELEELVAEEQALCGDQLELVG